MHITENGVQNNLHNNNDRKEDEDNTDAQKKNINKSKKRKNKLKADGDNSISKKMKIDNALREDSQIKADTNNIKVENNNEKMVLTTGPSRLNNEKIVTVNKSVGQKKNRRSQFNQMNIGKRKSDYDDPTMSLNAERLKTYGINAKKLKK